jgi:hypothetical protein
MWCLLLVMPVRITPGALFERHHCYWGTCLTLDSSLQRGRFTCFRGCVPKACRTLRDGWPMGRIGAGELASAGTAQYTFQLGVEPGQTCFLLLHVPTTHRSAPQHASAQGLVFYQAGGSGGGSSPASTAEPGHGPGLPPASSIPLRLNVHFSNSAFFLLMCVRSSNTCRTRLTAPTACASTGCMHAVPAAHMSVHM